VKFLFVYVNGTSFSIKHKEFLQERLLSPEEGVCPKEIVN
jgi:hypothetical protein